MVESLLSLLGHLSILTNTYDAVNPYKNSSKRVFPTQTLKRQSKEPPILEMETLNALEIKEELQ
jgi:hypothetical protein